MTVQEEQELFPWSSAGGSAAEHICTTGLELQRALQRQKAVGKRSASPFRWLRAKSVRVRTWKAQVQQSAGSYLGAEGMRDPD